MPYFWVCGIGNTEFSPLSGRNREVLARAAICQHVTCCGSEATAGSDGWKLWFVTLRSLSLLSRLFYTSQCPTQHLAVRLRQSSGTAAASQQLSVRDQEAHPGVLPCPPATAPSLQKVHRTPLYFFHQWNSAILEVKYSDCLMTFSGK